MKDNFSALASGYANFRPHYPDEMIHYIVSFAQHKSKALDVATGSGQVAVALSPFFDEVYATDISSRQLENAKMRPNIYYSVTSAEHSGFDNGVFDLITVAQAIHWFDFGLFYEEVRRILKRGGVIAVMGYGLFSVDKKVDAVIHMLYKDILGDYWDAERRYIDEMYQTIPFPFDELKTKSFTNTLTWTFEHLIGYLNTWSAVKHYREKMGQDPIYNIEEKLKQAWGGGQRQVIFPLLLRMGRV